MQKSGNRHKVCRFCTYDGTPASEKGEILREVYRHWPEFRAYVASTGRDLIEYTVPVEKGSDETETIVISYADLERALENVKIAKRKKEAFELNVLHDMPQREAAQIMGITMVSVGQYVKQASRQLAEWYFADEEKRQALEKDTLKDASPTRK